MKSAATCWDRNQSFITRKERSEILLNQPRLANYSERLADKRIVTAEQEEEQHTVRVTDVSVTPAQCVCVCVCVCVLPDVCMFGKRWTGSLSWLAAIKERQGGRISVTECLKVVGQVIGQDDDVSLLVSWTHTHTHTHTHTQKSGEVLKSTEQFWSFTVKQSCSVLLNNWSSWDVI